MHRWLVAGLAVFWIFAAAMNYFGMAPTHPDFPIPPNAVVALCGALLLLGLFRARRTVPPRQPTVTIDEYWRDGRVSGAVNSVLFLLESSATFGAIWTMLSASWMSAAVSLASIAVMAFHSPAHFERLRSS